MIWNRYLGGFFGHCGIVHWVPVASVVLLAIMAPAMTQTLISPLNFSVAIFCFMHPLECPSHPVAVVMSMQVARPD